MKYGLITFKNTENIGDDIQSYVAIRFLPKIDYYIEREKMDLFLPNEKKQVVTIMNGWFLHSKINFPISPYIYPIYISTHFSSYNFGGIETEYLNSYTSAKLNEYGPIGCRDSGTMVLLNKNNIENYFSGCLTLTIQADKNIKKKDYICIVDVDESVENKLNNELNNMKIIKKTHVLNKEKNSKLTYDERFNNVKKLLDAYQSAKLVITSRLHCALPCLALGTPVLLLYDEDKDYTKDRLSDYAKILNHMTTKEFLNSDINDIKNISTNPNDYIEIRNSIEKKVKKMINDSNKKLNTKLPELEKYEELYIKPKKNIDELYGIAISDMYIKKNDYINLTYERDYWKKEFNDAIQLMDKVKKEKEYLYEELKTIKNSKGYKSLEKLRKFKRSIKFKK